jgi:tRNA(fMet)-specific endonuclease VapC
VPGRFLLDTSVIVPLFAGDPRVAQALGNAADVFVPSVALGELFYGARKSSRSSANLAQTEALAASIPVLACDLDTARHYGEIKDRLRAIGRPLPENDIWIAAVARQHGLTLATRDAHFEQVAGLDVTSW